jgi:hypothetical protein
MGLVVRTIAWACVLRAESSSARHSSSSVDIPMGSKFSRSVPSKHCESCGIIDILLRRSCRPSFEMSTPSM